MSSRDQTLQVLAIETSRRLTMHAGHTPNHSHSLFPTMTTTADEPMGHLEPRDDVPLRGLLMVKNLASQDDVFFAKLAQKLESVRRGQDARERVLRAPLQGFGAAAGPLFVPTQPRPIGGDAPHGGRDEAQVGDNAADEADEADMEPDVPLKLKKTSNFGAPFGST